MQENSVLLSERSIASSDLKNAIGIDSVWLNVASKSSFLPFQLLLAVGCLAALFYPTKSLQILTWPVVAACSPTILGWLVSIGSAVKLGSESSRKTKLMLSSYVWQMEEGQLSRIEKKFQWLESKNSLPCPQQLAVDEET